MTKTTLADVGNLIDATTAANTINSNSAAIVTAIENTLSRDGTSPNQMNATLDMNGNRIVNLPTPITVTEPARLVDLNTVIGGGTITVNPLPSGGATSQILQKNSSTNFDVSWVNPAVVASSTVAIANTIADLKATDTVVKMAHLVAPGRSGQFAWRLGDYSAHVAADTNNGVYVKSNNFSAATGAWVRIFDDATYQSLWFGTVDDYATNNTAIINTIITTTDVLNGVGIPRRTAYINIEPGVTFNSADLSFLPAVGHCYVYLKYFANSDTTKGVYSGGGGTDEQIILSINSGFPGDVSGGMVAEYSFNAPLHPAYILNISKQVDGADAHFGANQTRVPTPSLPARASYNIFDENVIRWRAVYENYGNYSNPSGVSLQPFGWTWSLANVGTTGWPASPVAGTVVTGVTSGAKGYKATNQLNPTLVLNLVGLTGTFIEGEQVTDGVTTSTNSISGGGVVLENKTYPSLIFGVNDPVLTYAMFPLNAITAFSVGGRMTLAPSTAAVAVQLKETVTNSALLFTNTAGAVPSTGRQIVLTGTNRLVTVNGVTNGNGSTGTGLVGGVAAHATFTNGIGGASPTNSFNVASVTRTGAGVYAVVFSNALANANYSVALGNAGSNTIVGWQSKTTSGFSIFNVIATTGVLTDLGTAVDFAVIGGQ